MKNRKGLVRYIKESEDTEELIYKVDTFYNNYPQEKDSFVDVLTKCYNDKTIDVKKLEQYVKDANIEIKNIIDFVQDNVDGSQEIMDYMYLYKNLIQTILADRSEKNEYSKKIIGY